MRVLVSERRIRRREWKSRSVWSNTSRRRFWKIGWCANSAIKKQRRPNKWLSFSRPLCCSSTSKDFSKFTTLNQKTLLRRTTLLFTISPLSPFKVIVINSKQPSSIKALSIRVTTLSSYHHPTNGSCLTICKLKSPTISFQNKSTFYSTNSNESNIYYIYHFANTFYQHTINTYYYTQ